MYIDKLGEFSDAQAVTAAAGSTNTVDLGVANQDIGTGEDLYVVVVVDVAMTDASSDSTITVALEGDSTTTFTPDGTQDLFVIPAVTGVGTVFYAKLDPASAPLQYQYIRLLYTPANGNLTTGSFSSYLTDNIDRYVNRASGFTVS